MSMHGVPLERAQAAIRAARSKGSKLGLRVHGAGVAGSADDRYLELFVTNADLSDQQREFTVRGGVRVVARTMMTADVL